MEISGGLSVVRTSDDLRDGIDQTVRTTEVGSCSLQEEQMLGRSVKALISRRNRDGDRLTQSPPAGFAAPHQRQPGTLERSLVRGPASERLGNTRMRPDKTPG